jgi:hypothetical protein
MKLWKVIDGVEVFVEDSVESSAKMESRVKDNNASLGKDSILNADDFVSKEYMEEFVNTIGKDVRVDRKIGNSVLTKKLKSIKES